MPPNSIFSSDFDSSLQKPSAAKSQSTNPMCFQDVMASSPGHPKAHILNSKSRNPDGSARQQSINTVGRMAHLLNSLAPPGPPAAKDTRPGPPLSVAQSKGLSSTNTLSPNLNPLFNERPEMTQTQRLGEGQYIPNSSLYQ